MTEEEKIKLFTELGKLAFERANLTEKLNKNAERANKIGTILKKLEKVKNE